jgi:hypothetical protein
LKNPVFGGIRNNSQFTENGWAFVVPQNIKSPLFNASVQGSGAFHDFTLNVGRKPRAAWTVKEGFHARWFGLFHPIVVDTDKDDVPKAVRTRDALIQRNKIIP